MNSEPASKVLDALANALSAERHALLERDVDALKLACATKNDCLRDLVAIDAKHFAPGPNAERLRALVDLNRANGELISRRRRDVEWTLTRLGRAAGPPAYDPHGMLDATVGARSLASA